MSDGSYFEEVGAALDRLAGLVPVSERSHYRKLAAEARKRQEACKVAQRIVFDSPRPGLFYVAGAVLETELIGMSAAYLAIRHGPFAAADLAIPGAACPHDVVRKGLAKAADMIEQRTDCKELASAIRCIKVSGGMVRYDRRPGAPEFIPVA